MDDASAWQHQVTHDGGTTTIRIEGELDLATVAALGSLFDEHLEPDTTTTLHVDLAGVSFMDSSALGVLVAGYQNAAARGLRFTVINPSDPARRILSLTGLLDVLTGT